MKNFKILIVSAIVAFTAFISTFSVGANAEENDERYCNFYTFISVDQETGDTVYTVAADASAHLSNFTLEYAIMDVLPEVGELIMLGSESSGIDLDELYNSEPVYNYIKYIYKSLAGNDDDFPSKKIAEQQLKEGQERIIDIIGKFLQEYVEGTRFASDVSRLIEITKSPALNGLLNSGVNFEDNIYVGTNSGPNNTEIDEYISQSFYTIMYNGVSNLGEEYAYEVYDTKVVDLFTLKVPSLPEVKMNVEGVGEIAIPGLTLLDMEIAQIAAGTMEGGSVIPLDVSCYDQMMRPGDYDLDGEVTVRDLIAFQLYNTDGNYMEKMAYRNSLYLEAGTMAKMWDYEDAIALSAQNGQYLQMYLCDIIGYGEYCNKIYGQDRKCFIDVVIGDFWDFIYR